MKIERNNKYLTICTYALISVLIAMFLLGIMLNINIIWGGIVRFISATLSIFKPLIIGLIIAYFIDPVVDLYVIRLKGNYSNSKKRLLATLLGIITVVAFIGVFVLMVSMNMREVLHQTSIGDIASTISAYITYFQGLIQQMIESLSGGTLSTMVTRIVTQMYDFINKFIFTLGERTISILATIGKNIIDIVLGVILAIYIVKDKPKLLKICSNILKRILPEKIYTEVSQLGGSINTVLTGYIRGQVLDTVIMGALTSILLTIIGLDFAIIIGIITGIFNLIPYFGPIVGVVLAGVIGTLGQNPNMGLYAMIAVFALQQLDAWFIVPKVLGENVKLHPIVVLLAIVIGGELYGLIGMLAGVPIAALIRVILIRYLGDIFNENYTVVK
ncbi:MAG: hypothetical protein ATN36_07745 [Epulopiscium sp. Nele67-Bin005]|nr:MAG: hypothetical protein ATN36_07745 [Epulopiscium sp. Nele67-Bin005]